MSMGTCYSPILNTASLNTEIYIKMWFCCRPSVSTSMITVYSAAAAAPCYASSLSALAENTATWEKLLRTQWVKIPNGSNNPGKTAGAEFSCYAP